ncbi:DNA-directed RNA polymerase I subunit 2 [Tanacetum coccineum]
MVIQYGWGPDDSLTVYHHGNAVTALSMGDNHESWGFVCPVHAPDGAPCRLLNHMTASCRITSNYDSEGQIKDFAKIQKSILSVLVGAGVLGKTSQSTAK